MKTVSKGDEGERTKRDEKTNLGLDLEFPVTDDSPLDLVESEFELQEGGWSAKSLAANEEEKRTNSELVNRVHVDVDSDVGVHSSPSLLDDLGDLSKSRKEETKLDQKCSTRTREESDATHVLQVGLLEPSLDDSSS